jgi:uncharacterized phage-associated protein
MLYASESDQVNNVNAAPKRGVAKMVSVHDVAAYIVEKHGPMTAMKLEKLVYYSQAWSLVWDESPLFRERIQAWAAGPVVPALYYRHRGEFEITRWDGNPDALSHSQRDSVDAVLRFYGTKTSQWLSDLTHSEEPWIKARAGLAPLERGNREITLASMAEYYSSL